MKTTTKKLVFDIDNQTKFIEISITVEEGDDGQLFIHTQTGSEIEKRITLISNPSIVSLYEEHS